MILPLAHERRIDAIESKPGTGTTVTVDLCAAPAVAAVSETVADGPSAVVTITDVKAAALVRRVLESLGTVVRSDSDPNSARVWVVDPEAVDLKQVKRWTAGRGQQRRLVLFGKFPPDPALVWEALQPVVIEDPDDYEGLRTTISRAVTAG